MIVRPIAEKLFIKEKRRSKIQKATGTSKEANKGGETENRRNESGKKGRGTQERQQRTADVRARSHALLCATPAREFKANNVVVNQSATGSLSLFLSPEVHTSRLHARRPHEVSRAAAKD